MISLNINMMTCQVLVWLFYIMSVFCVPRLLWCLCHSCIRINDMCGTFWKIYRYVCLSICPSIELNIKVLLESLPEHRPSLHVYPHSFRQYQIILLYYRGNGLLEGFYIQQRRDPELTTCQGELKFDVLPVIPPRYVTRLYVCRNNLWQVYQTDNSILWDRFALRNTTRDSDHCWLRIYEWIPYRPWADGGPHAPPHYLHSLVFSFTPGSVDLEKAC